MQSNLAISNAADAPPHVRDPGTVNDRLRPDTESGHRDLLSAANQNPVAMATPAGRADDVRCVTRRRKLRVSISQEKIITFFKIERMTLNLLAIWPKHKIEMQTIYIGRYVSTGLGIRVSGPEYRKMEHRETLKLGCCCENVKTVMCQKGGILPLMNR